MNVDLATPGKIGALKTPNRIVMAPMTRSRAAPHGVPSDMAIEYYAQRASAALILTEGTAPSQTMALGTSARRRSRGRRKSRPGRRSPGQ